MNRLIVLICISILIVTSCNVSEKNYHDGHYFTVFNSFGLSFAEIKIDVRGNDITVDNSLTGVSKMKCKQFSDRIEYEENDGTIRILPVLENGDLKFSDNITLVRTR